MKILNLTVVLALLCVAAYAQDGSDIKYIKPQAVDTSVIGHYVHFDFFKDSHYGQSIDTIVITIDNRPVKFFEVRTDDGFNQWFHHQSLQSVDKYEGQTIKISQCRLDSITTKSFLVTMYVDYYANDKLLKHKSRLIKYWFNKKDIVRVLEEWHWAL